MLFINYVEDDNKGATNSRKQLIILMVVLVTWQYENQLDLVLLFVVPFEFQTFYISAQKTYKFIYKFTKCFNL